QVRQVQRALAAGLTDDPELTRDLMPGAGPTPADLPALRTPPEDVELTAPVSSLTDVGQDQPTTAVAEPTTTLGAVPTRADTPEPPSRPTKRRGPLMLLVAVAALMVAGLFGWYLSIGRYETVPNLVSLSEQEATKTAEAAGFAVAVGEPAYSEVIEKGAVVSTDP